MLGNYMIHKKIFINYLAPNQQYTLIRQIVSEKYNEQIKLYKKGTGARVGSNHNTASF